MIDGTNEFSTRAIAAAARLRDRIDQLVFDGDVAYTYNPLVYAWEPHVLYLERYASSPKRNLFLGMNPGPFGMAQTGVPFGEVEAVRDWLGIEAPVSSPERTHPKRPVQGFDCPRSEVSGRRLWGLFRELFGTAEHFFQDNFVVNYCPLIWMSESGANITPDKLPADQRRRIDEVCTEHLVELIRVFRPLRLIGVGGFATKRLEAAMKSFPDTAMQTGTLLHPSPASPAANKNWPELPARQLRDMGLI